MIYGFVEVTLLGTGAATPTPERFLPSILVRDRMGSVVLLDAGEGAQIRLMEVGVSPSSVDLIAITHEHGDHVNGLPGLLQSMYIGGRSRELTILAPPSISWFVSEALEAREDRLGFKVNIVTLRNRGSIEVSGASGDTLQLTWFPVCHSVEAYGFRLEWKLRPRIDVGKLESLGLKPGPWVRDLIEKGEVKLGDLRVKLEDVMAEKEAIITMAYTGDTAPCDLYTEYVRGSRILVHDSTYHSELESEAKLKGHSTSKQAAQKAVEAGVEVLVLTHISSRYRGFEARRLLEEAKRIFPNTILARDLARLTLGARKHTLGEPKTRP